MKLSKIFEEKPKRWGFRGDPYFWDYLKEQAESMEIISPEELEKWIKEEYLSLSGKPLTDEYIDFAVIEQFAHGGMSSGGFDNTWWMEEGIPLLKSRLVKLLPPKNMLETERLILRPWQETDAEECYKYAKDPRVGPMAGWPVHESVENSRQVIRNALMVPETYAIVLKKTGLPIGSISLKFHSDLAEKDDEAELGYWLGVPYWGQGIMPEAAKELIRHGFEDLKLARIWCGYYEGNEKSKRVQEKLGFKYQWKSENLPVVLLNETRTGYVNLMTKEDWLAKKIFMRNMTSSSDR